MKICSVVAFLLGCVEIDSLLVNYRNDTCYGTLGCFSTDSPFTTSTRISVLPQSPEVIRTKFLLYTRVSSITPQVLDARELSTIPRVWTNFKEQTTKILIHGFLDRPTYFSWWKNMIKELLKNGDYNVILVDWSGGNLPPYTQATANGRVVGAQVAELIKTLNKQLSTTVADFHVIGHSLGAHTAGYAGERLPGLARITGLDPAGPYFENTDRRVRLDETDAIFVDIIHTDAKSLIPEFGQGTREKSGHADFYPNLGRNQPGCSIDVLSLINLLGSGFVLEGAVETINCNHMRAVKLFTESINSPCLFLAVPCSTEKDFINGKCTSCSDPPCARMGFHATKLPGQPQKYFLKTAAQSSFCLPLSVMTAS